MQLSLQLLEETIDCHLNFTAKIVIDKLENNCYRNGFPWLRSPDKYRLILHKGAALTRPRHCSSLENHKSKSLARLLIFSKYNAKYFSLNWLPDNSLSTVADNFWLCSSFIFSLCANLNTSALFSSNWHSRRWILSSAVPCLSLEKRIYV